VHQLRKTHGLLLSSSKRSWTVHERFVQQYGRTLRVFGMAKVIYYRQQEFLIEFASLYVQFDQRILTLDPTAIGHVLTEPTGSLPKAMAISSIYFRYHW
jgi:hypothetical protein